MPKQKTHKGIAKRFKLTATGKVMRKKAGKSHLMSATSAKRTRQLRRPTLIKSCDDRRIAPLMPKRK